MHVLAAVELDDDLDDVSEAWSVVGILRPAALHQRQHVVIAVAGFADVARSERLLSTVLSHPSYNL